MKTTYYFIRHAEKEYDRTANPHLNPMGLKRALYWAEVLYPKGIDLVFCTPLIRTYETAAPLLDKLQIEHKYYDPIDLYNTSFQMISHGKTALVVGHQDTTPLFVNRILKERKYTYIEDDEFGNLYQVTIDDKGAIHSRLTVHNPFS